MAVLKIPRNTQRFLLLVKTEYYVILKGQHKCVNLGTIIISKSLFIVKNIIFLMVKAKMSSGCFSVVKAHYFLKIFYKWYTFYFVIYKDFKQKGSPSS